MARTCDWYKVSQGQEILAECHRPATVEIFWALPDRIVCLCDKHYREYERTGDLSWLEEAKVK